MREWWERDGRRTVIAIVIGVVKLAGFAPFPL